MSAAKTPVLQDGEGRQLRYPAVVLGRAGLWVRPRPTGSG
jgi:hypothetical protein